MAKQKEMETVKVHTADSMEDAYEDMGAGPQEGLSTSEGAKALDVVLDRVEAEEAVRETESGLDMQELSDLVHERFGGAERRDFGDAEDAEDGEAGGEDDGGGEDFPDSPSEYTKRHEFTDAQLKLPVSIRVDGEDVDVSLGEALKGYSRTANFTRKTQELAKQRKEVKAARSEADDLAGAYTERLEAFAHGLGQLMSPEQQRALLTEYASAKQAQKAARAVALQDTLEEEHEALRTSLGWDDDEAVKEGYQAIVDGAAEEYGFTGEDLDGITDHRAVLVLHDALAYRKAKGSATKALKGSRRKSTTLKPSTRHVADSGPGARKNKGASKLRKRASETGNIHDAAAAIGAIMGEDG